MVGYLGRANTVVCNAYKNLRRSCDYSEEENGFVREGDMRFLDCPEIKVFKILTAFDAFSTQAICSNENYSVAVIR